MKKITCIMLTALCAQLSWAQAYEGVLKVKKTEEPAIIMAYNYPADVVESAIKAKLADMRLQGKNSKGMLQYNAAVISDVTASPLDYSFKLDESGKTGKEVTTLYMVMKGSVSGGAANVSGNAKQFLQNLVPNVERSSIIFQVKKQDEVLAKEEKKLNDLKSDNDKLQKKIKDNESDQKKQQRVVDSQRAILDDLRAKQR